MSKKPGKKDFVAVGSLSEWFFEIFLLTKRLWKQLFRCYVPALVVFICAMAILDLLSYILAGEKNEQNNGLINIALFALVLVALLGLLLAFILIGVGLLASQRIISFPRSIGVSAQAAVASKSGLTHSLSRKAKDARNATVASTVDMSGSHELLSYRQLMKYGFGKLPALLLTGVVFVPLSLLGLAFCIIPGVLIGITYQTMAAPAVVYQGNKAIPQIFQLVKKNASFALRRLFTCGFIQSTGLLAAFFVSLASAFIVRSFVLKLSVAVQYHLFASTYLIILPTVLIALLPLMSVVSAVTYRQLRTLTTPVTLEELALEAAR